MSIPILDQFCSADCNQLATNLIKDWGDDPCRGECRDVTKVILPLQRNSTSLMNNNGYGVLEIRDKINLGNRFDKLQQALFRCSQFRSLINLGLYLFNL
jgi:hypothetical protein